MKTDLGIPMIAFSDAQIEQLREIIREELEYFEVHLALEEKQEASRQLDRLVAETPEIAADPPIIPEEPVEPYDVREDEEVQPEVEETEVQEVSEASAADSAGASGSVLLDVEPVLKVTSGQLPGGMDVPMGPESEVLRSSAPFAYGSQTPRAVIAARLTLALLARSATAPPALAVTWASKSPVPNGSLTRRLDSLGPCR